MLPRSRVTFATPTQTELAAQDGQGDFMAALLLSADTAPEFKKARCRVRRAAYLRPYRLAFGGCWFKSSASAIEGRRPLRPHLRSWDAWLGAQCRLSPCGPR